MIDFPTNPVTGQVYTYSGRTWVWDDTGWQRQINAGQQVSVFMLASALVENNVDPLPYLIDPDWTEITYV